MLGILRVNDKAHGAIQARNQEKAVDERDVVRNEEGAAGLRNMLLADEAEAVQSVGQDH